MQNTYSGKVFPTTTGTYRAYNLCGMCEIYPNPYAANIFSRTGGPLVHYKGFHIAPNFKIFRKGVQVFSARWQMCDSMDEAKDLIDRSVQKKLDRVVKNTYVPKEPDNYDLFQMEQYGNVLAPVYVDPDGNCANTREELQRLEHYKNQLDANQ